MGNSRKHGCSTRGAAPATDAVARVSDCVCVFFFFFFFSDSRRFGSICTDAARFMPNRLQFAPNRADSAKIGSYRPPAETGRKRPKSALNMAGKAETCILLSFFVNQGIVCVF